MALAVKAGVLMADWDTGTHDVPDYELRKSPGGPPVLPPSRRPVLLWIVVAGLVVGAAIAAYIAFGGRYRSVKVVTEPAAVTEEQAVRPLGGEAEPIVLPPLDDTDPIVRELVNRITSHPRLAAWLATDGLIRNFVAAVSSVGEGKTPAVQLRVLRPSTGFRVIDRGGALYLDPRGYERYDTLAAAAASIDPAGAANVYATLKPRIEQAYRELGFPDAPFDRALERAIVLLLETPIVEGPVRVQQQGATGYAYAAPDLEALTGGQKQLLRTGPNNVRAIQTSLRAIALALGIPAERLPRPRS